VAVILVMCDKQCVDRIVEMIKAAAERVFPSDGFLLSQIHTVATCILAKLLEHRFQYIQLEGRLLGWIVLCMEQNGFCIIELFLGQFAVDESMNIFDCVKHIETSIFCNRIFVIWKLLYPYRPYPTM